MLQNIIFWTILIIKVMILVLVGMYVGDILCHILSGYLTDTHTLLHAVRVMTGAEK